jgi:hypothetical protein
MAKSKNGTFPVMINVVLESPKNDDPFLMVVDAQADQVEDGQKVAVYRLAQVKTMRVTRKLEE